MPLHEQYEFFSACFPMLGMSEELFAEVSDYDNCGRFFTNGGFAMMKDDAITLLAVLPEYRGRGIGSALLNSCENAIAEKGFDRVRLGGFLYGAVGDSCVFFEKRGYTLGYEYSEMEIALSDYRDPLPEVGADFRFYGDMEEIRSAVSKVDDDWVQYFNEGGEYFCGFDGGRLVSFCSVEDDVSCLISKDGVRTGSVGCVGTIPEARGKGVGLKMVSLALEELKRRGCGQCFIHQTHLADWYGKLGARTVLKFRSAEKEL